MGYSGEDPVGNLRALEVVCPPGVLFNGLPAFGTPVLIKAVFFDRDCLFLLDTES